MIKMFDSNHVNLNRAAQSMKYRHDFILGKNLKMKTKYMYTAYMWYALERWTKNAPEEYYDEC